MGCVQLQHAAGTGSEEMVARQSFYLFLSCHVGSGYAVCRFSLLEGGDW